VRGRSLPRPRHGDALFAEALRERLGRGAEERLLPRATREAHDLPERLVRPHQARHAVGIRRVPDQPQDRAAADGEQTPILQRPVNDQGLPDKVHRAGHLAPLLDDHAEPEEGLGRAALVPDAVVPRARFLEEPLRPCVVPGVEGVDPEVVPRPGGAPCVARPARALQRLLQQGRAPLPLPREPRVQR
jgi:hypothetical protein